MLNKLIHRKQSMNMSWGRAPHRRQDVSVKSPLVIGLAVVARFGLRRRDLWHLRAVRLVMGVGRRGVVVLLVLVVMG